MKSIQYLLHLLFLAALPFGVFCQQISGKVIDNETGDPVAFANVFFVGTLTGTTTDLDGNFTLEVQTDGRYDLAITFVGYKEYIQTIDTESSIPLLSIGLEPEIIQLNDVMVNADTAGWENNFQSFKPLFIGTTENAQKTAIINPRDIFLFYDKVEKGLYAHSKKEIVIENDALGYRINYVMKTFEMNYQTGLFKSFGIPRFEEMAPRGKGQLKRWSKRRAKTYHGSFSHFLRALRENTFSKEGFIVQELFKIPNRKRPPQELIDQKLAELRESGMAFGSFVLGSSQTTTHNNKEVEKRLSQSTIPSEMKTKIDSLRKSGAKVTMVKGNGSSTFSTDSLRYWNRMNRLPVTIDSLGAVITSNESLVRGTELNYKGYLQVVYTKEPEDPSYASQRIGGGIDNKQTSTILILEPLQLHENGYYDVEKILFLGYFGWASRLAEMLPLDYLPQG